MGFNIPARAIKPMNLTGIPMKQILSQEAVNPHMNSTATAEYHAIPDFAIAGRPGPQASGHPADPSEAVHDIVTGGEPLLPIEAWRQPCTDNFSRERLSEGFF